MERLIRNCTFAAPSIPRAGNPWTQSASDLGGYMKSERPRLHTQRETHIHSVKCQLGECQRDGGIVSTPGSTSSDVRDSWLFGEVVYIESRAVTQSCSGSDWRDFLKGGLRHARQEPHMQLPCQQGERIEGRVCSHSVQLRRLIRKVQSKGISHSQHSPSGRAEAV